MSELKRVVVPMDDKIEEMLHKRFETEQTDMLIDLLTVKIGLLGCSKRAAHGMGLHVPTIQKWLLEGADPSGSAFCRKLYLRVCEAECQYEQRLLSKLEACADEGDARASIYLLNRLDAMRKERMAPPKAEDAPKPWWELPTDD